MKKTGLFVALFLSGSAWAADPLEVPVTYANTHLRWERLENGAWKSVEEWGESRMKMGRTYGWDTTRRTSETIQRLMLRVTWTGQAPRVELGGGFARLSPEHAPVRIQVQRGLADGQAWTFGVPTEKGLAGHRVVAQVRLETVMEPLAK